MHVVVQMFRGFQIELRDLNLAAASWRSLFCLLVLPFRLSKLQYCMYSFWDNMRAWCDIVIVWLFKEGHCPGGNACLHPVPIGRASCHERQWGVRRRQTSLSSHIIPRLWSQDLTWFGHHCRMTIPTCWLASPFSVHSKSSCTASSQSGNGKESCEVKNLRAGPGAMMF